MCITMPRFLSAGFIVISVRCFLIRESISCLFVLVKCCLRIMLPLYSLNITFVQIRLRMVPKVGIREYVWGLRNSFSVII